MKLELAEDLLRTNGYVIAFREAGWWECLVVHPGERWIGHGADRAEALRDAIRQAFPSRIAQRLLFGALTTDSGIHHAVVPEAHALEAIPASGPPCLEGCGAVEAPEPANDVGHPSVDPGAAHDHSVGSTLAANDVTPIEDHASVDPDAPAATDRGDIPATTLPASTADPGARRDTPQPSTVTVAETAAADERPDGTPTSAYTVREAMAEIQSLRRQIEGDRDELALTAPRRQRLVMLGWIAHARASQERFASEVLLDKAVASIARMLSGYCQLWWPGSVRALRVQTRPEDVLADLPLPVARLPHSWAEAAELANQQLHAIEEEDERRGRDDHGWIDAARLVPAPREPDALLAELVTQVEALSGPLNFPPSAKAVPDASALIEWVRKLRWLRDSAQDACRWGSLAGRFRLWVREHPQEFAEAGRALDPDYLPDRSWAHVLGRDPESIERRRALREVFAVLPNPDGTADLAELCTWLGRALPLADTHHAHIVSAVTPYRARIADLDAGALPGADRRMRRRLSKLQKDLQLSPASLPPCPILEPEVPDDAVAHGPSVEPGLREPVVVVTRGKRALFVSNRPDPVLRGRLKDLFEFSVLDWLEAESRRRQALEGSIAGGSYDFVLGATGFLSHSVDGQIGRACRRGQVRYVRVHRGRPLACLRAMARELGLTQHPSTGHDREDPSEA